MKEESTNSITNAYAIPGLDTPNIKKQLISESMQTFIENIVCRHFCMNIDDLYIKTRRRDISTPRHLCISLFTEKNLCGYTLSKAAEVYGNEHCNAIHAQRKIRNWFQTNSQFRNIIKQILFDLNLKEENVKFLHDLY
jgi:chromosomal replication initiation ATPase DnaA